jgi:SAM-dependent methyltransferase
VSDRRFDAIVQSYEEHPLRAATILDRILRHKNSTEGLTELDLAVDGETGITDQNHPNGIDAVIAIAKSVGLRGGEKVLDVGSGLGGPLRVLAHLHGCRGHGVELTPARYRDALKLTRLVALDGLVSFTCGDFLAVDVPGGPFDLTIGQGAFGHFADLDPVMRKCAALLIPAGWLVVEDCFLAREPAGDEAEKLATLCDCWNGHIVAQELWRQALAQAGLALQTVDDLTSVAKREGHELLHLSQRPGQTPVPPRERLGWRLSAELFEAGVITFARLLARKPGAAATRVGSADERRDTAHDG